MKVSELKEALQALPEGTDDYYVIIPDPVIDVVDRIRTAWGEEAHIGSVACHDPSGSICLLPVSPTEELIKERQDRSESMTGRRSNES